MDQLNNDFGVTVIFIRKFNKQLYHLRKSLNYSFRFKIFIQLSLVITIANLTDLIEPLFLINLLISEHFNAILSKLSYFYLTAIPALAALAYFIYREHRDSAIKLTIFYRLGYFIIFSLLFSASIHMIPELEKLLDNIHFYPFFYYLNFNLFIMTTVLFFFIISYSIYLINSKHYMKRSTRQIVKNAKSLENLSDKNKFSIEYYHNNIKQKLDSIFFILIYSVENNYNNFNEYFDNTSNLLKILWIHSDDLEVKTIYQKDIIGFDELYGVIMNNLFYLLTTLHESDYTENIKSIQSNLRNLVPFEARLNITYFRTFKDIALYTSKGDLYFFNESLLFFEKHFSIKVDTDNKDYNFGFLLVYQSLLKNNIGKDDLENITTITYSLQRIVFPELSEKHDIEKRNDQVKIMKESVKKSMPLNADEKSKQKIMETSLFILFQTTLKSIEIGNYAITGQLIKRIVTDYEAKDIQKTFNEFNKYKGCLGEFAKSHEILQSVNDLIEDFSFNPISYHYCVHKLILLLLGQELYTLNNNISFSHSSKGKYHLSFLSHLNKPYLRYVKNKINNVGLKYGLLFLEDKDYLTNLVDVIEYEL